MPPKDATNCSKWKGVTVIYVDDAAWPYRGTMYCHMMTDGDIQELHDFAAQLGLRRSWFQDKPSGVHYDISKNKRYQAIRLGAVAVTTREMLRLCHPRYSERVKEQGEQS